jgi:Flp pilus assembly protein TadG
MSVTRFPAAAGVGAKADSPVRLFSGLGKPENRRTVSVRMARVCKSKSESESERGAVAVEFALLLPILVALLLGIMEFGLAYNAQITVTGAAREGARTMAVENDPAAARRAARAAARALDPALADGQIAIGPASCAAGGTATVVITYQLDSMTGFFGPGVALTGRAAMRCGG